MEPIQEREARNWKPQGRQGNGEIVSIRRPLICPRSPDQHPSHHLLLQISNAATVTPVATPTGDTHPAAYLKLRANLDPPLIFSRHRRQFHLRGLFRFDPEL